MKVLLSIAIASFTACAEPAAETVLEYVLVPVPLGVETAEQYDPALRAWDEIGIRRVPLPDGATTVDDLRGAGIVPVVLHRVPGLVRDLEVYGLADRATGDILIDADLDPFRLAVTVAHEVGHVVLDTGEHTSCGIMGGRDVLACDEDLELACRTAGAGCK